MGADYFQECDPLKWVGNIRPAKPGVGEACYIENAIVDLNVTIGNGVRIAAQVCIISANHNFNSRNKYIYEQGITKKGIFIEDDVWVAAGVQILDGVNIQRGCVIAAGAVVTESTESYGIYGGVPAKLIKYREGK